MPTRDQLRNEYDRRFHKVVAYIDRNLDRRVSTKELAMEASLSEFHFHRVFAAHFGETIGSYTARRRLEIAAGRLLAQPRLSILETALGVGFGSSEAFSRAFKQQFGCAPSLWPKRFKESKIDQPNSSLDHETRLPFPYDATMHANDLEQPLDVRIVERNSKPVYYFRYQGPFGPSIAEFWGQVVYPWMAQNDLIGRPRYGISLDDPMITDPAKCRYDACVEVDDPGLPEGPATRGTIPGGRYASAEFWGRSEEIGAAWDRILRSWLPSSGYLLDARPFIEYYSPDHRYDAAAGRFGCDILVPITRAR